MQHYVGLDVSLKTTWICVMDGSGTIVCRGKVDTHPEMIAGYLARHGVRAAVVGLETGQLSTWLYHSLRGLGLPVKCICARHAKPFLKTLMNKTDRNDATGLAELMRFGVYKEVRVKSLRTFERRAVVSGRDMLVEVQVKLENQIRGLLKTFGLKVGLAKGGAFESRVCELLVKVPSLYEAIEPLLAARTEIRQQIAKLRREIRRLVRKSPTCRRLMTADGIGEITALAYLTTIEDPDRFERSSSVGAYLGLTPKRFSSGEIDYTGRISKCGDKMLRKLLYEAAGVILTRTKRSSDLKRWGLKLRKRIGFNKAKIAVARKLAIILHRMWIDGTDFQRHAA